MKHHLALVMLLVFATFTNAQQPKTDLLWPDGAPGANGTEEKDKPTLISYVVPKEKSVGTAIVICPGGGYGHLAMGHEGHEIAKWLNGIGISAFICDYRHRGKGYGHPAPMQDAQRAIRIVRSKAEQYGYLPNQIGVLGFSAGGHLASTVATHFDAGLEDENDSVQTVSCRPDFAVLCYPVIAFAESFTHRGSQQNLLGKKAPINLLLELSNEKQVTAENPPTFLWHTAEDKGVSPKNSIWFFLALQRVGVPAELHIYEKGRHGIGLGKDVPGASNWPRDCESWLKRRGFLK